jgi:hypothetical protein
MKLDLCQSLLYGPSREQPAAELDAKPPPLTHRCPGCCDALTSSVCGPRSRRSASQRGTTVCDQTTCGIFAKIIVGILKSCGENALANRARVAFRSMQTSRQGRQRHHNCQQKSSFKPVHWLRQGSIIQNAIHHLGQIPIVSNNLRPRSIRVQLGPISERRTHGALSRPPTCQTIVLTSLPTMRSPKRSPSRAIRSRSLAAVAARRAGYPRGLQSVD